MYTKLFIHPILPTTNWKWENWQYLLRRDSEHGPVESWPQRICNHKVENATSQDKVTFSRRCFMFHTLAILGSITTVPIGHAVPLRRTILDEERELNEQIRKKDEENRRNALRVAFEAVEKAANQLDDITKFVKDDDWKGIRLFTRLFNNAVEREGMEPLTRQLSSKQQRQDSLKLCKELTRTLQDMDQSAKREDSEAVLANLQKARQLITAFQEFKP